MNVKKTEGQTPEKVTPPSSPVTHFMGLRDDFDHFFDNMMLSPFARRLVELDPFRRHGLMAGGMMPRMDVVERDTNFELTAELPGVQEGDIDISVGEGCLTIRGEKKAESEDKTGNRYLSERSWGSFTRSFTLPETADQEHVSAAFDKGVLTLTIPKMAKAAPLRRKIDVKTTH